MVFYKFPEKFPMHLKGFLNPAYQSAPEKQETFEVPTALTLGFKGFQDRKQLSSLETLCFLQGFLSKAYLCL